MLTWMGKALCTGFVCAGLTMIGYWMGERRTSAIVSSTDTRRFQKVSDMNAFDTKTGQTCLMADLPQGFKTQEGYSPCEALAKQ